MGRPDLTLISAAARAFMAPPPYQFRVVASELLVKFFSAGFLTIASPFFWVVPQDLALFPPDQCSGPQCVPALSLTPLFLSNLRMTVRHLQRSPFHLTPSWRVFVPTFFACRRSPNLLLVVSQNPYHRSLFLSSQV